MEDLVNRLVSAVVVVGVLAGAARSPARSAVSRCRRR